MFSIISSLTFGVVLVILADSKPAGLFRLLRLVFISLLLMLDPQVHVPSFSSSCNSVAAYTVPRGAFFRQVKVCA